MAPKNGYVPAAALVQVESGLFLERATGAAYLAAKAASGGVLGIARPGGAYRTWQDQYNMKNGIPSYAYWNLNPNSSVGLAAPGYSSHGLGICVDAHGNSWMLANGERFGFYRPFGDRDPNHWQYRYPTWTEALAGNQRIVGPGGVRRRTEASAASAESGAPLPGGTIGTFDGWKYGDEATNGTVTSKVWFRSGGFWFWSGGFTDMGTHDLPDLNPVIPTDDRLVLATASALVRSAPWRSAPKVGENAADSLQDFGFWTIGEKVTLNGITTDLWYVTDDQKGFSWAGGYKSQEKAGLEEMAPVPEPPVITWPTTPYTFEAAGDFVTRVAPAHWSNFENEHSVPLAKDRKGFPALPSSVVLHQWGNPGDYLITSVINTFQARHDIADQRKSAHFVVNDDEIVQMVSLDHRAYHAGANGNDFVGIEIDPKMGPKTIANVRKVLTFLKERNEGEQLVNVLHKTLSNTTCGEWIEPHMLEFVIPTEFTVTFNDILGSPFAVKVLEGQKVTSPGTPTPPEGMYFVGWVTSEDRVLYEFSLPVTEDISLEAQYATKPIEEPDPGEEPGTPGKPDVPWFGIIASGVAAIVVAVLAAIFGGR